MDEQIISPLNASNIEVLTIIKTLNKDQLDAYFEFRRFEIQEETKRKQQDEETKREEQYEKTKRKQQETKQLEITKLGFYY